MNRRCFIIASCSAVAGAAPPAEESARPIGISRHHEPLGFDLAELDPWLDVELMRAHYGTVHADYVRKMHDTLQGVHLEVANVVSLLPAIKTMPTPPNPGSVVNLTSKHGPLPEKVQAELREYVGAHVNHTAFWRFLAPPGSGPTGPQGKVAEAIQTEFGSIAAFETAFTQAAMKHIGDGWAWLVYRPNGRLIITTTSNNDHPLMTDFVSKDECGPPILCLDLWKHAYASQYKDDREKYIAAWWKVVNWAFVSRAYTIVRANFTSVATVPAR